MCSKSMGKFPCFFSGRLRRWTVDIQGRIAKFTQVDLHGHQRRKSWGLVGSRPPQILGRGDRGGRKEGRGGGSGRVVK